MTTEPTAPTGGTEPTGATSELLIALGKDLSELVRAEFARLQSELSDTVRNGKMAFALLGAAGVLGAFAAATSGTVLLRMLESFLPKSLAAMVATGLYGAGAFTLARRGLDELRQARQSLPTAETVTSPTLGTP